MPDHVNLISSSIFGEIHEKKAEEILQCLLKNNKSELLSEINIDQYNQFINNTKISKETRNKFVELLSNVPLNNPPLPALNTEKSNKTEEITVPTVNTSDVDIETIKTHLDEFDALDKIEYKINKVLIVGDKSIGVKCMLHYLSEQPDFLKDNSEECSSNIKDFLRENKVDLEKLIHLSNDKNFLEDTRFYFNLYGFIINMFIILSESNEFKALSPKMKEKLIINLKDFVKQALDYLNTFMITYQIINDGLINSSYDLLYLMNSLTITHTVVRSDLTSVRNLYQKLLDAVQRNIQIYQSIRIQENNPEIVTTDEFADITKRLLDRLQKLEVEYTSLQQNVAQINSNNKNIEKFVSQRVIKLSKIA
jgi:tetrahydromethanopterin S-methyltransferase subunit G